MSFATKKLILLLLASLALTSAQAAVYQEPSDFVSESFQGNPPAPKVLWLNQSLRDQVAQVLGHPPNGMRMRYWQDATRTVWVMDEIGKELPITTGIVVSKGSIERLRVLVFRESRGWEVRHDFFTEQFHGVEMTGDGNLDKHIDGISGATLSVRAVQKLARVALMLDPVVQTSQDGKRQAP
jgi:hypothetical protein